MGLATSSCNPYSSLSRVYRSLETIAFSYDEHRSSYNEPLHVDQAKPWPVVE
ncbi:hypothetical protein AGABI1DRAFT_134351 [Agaricus bisporus var. burnettii JB137-S8]|uniref:Uncharacterized protein n=1 Tax=Agaricus bisporus var. burnettii (strain JB137-S8 / ATCC MYA-4627 / FGSC 10392) TaxID=597362 RepID=K5XGY3_AGABU|nr:uncharacterized protein AGABI1DRAFT_134351 [Agaricus bisporus var. burnettii JB137-S8]EKM73645.1 hypothetical protein AGABI1DRAFT_134351 [Agaricus bisporus var. burnettii JB137-S8]